LVHRKKIQIYRNYIGSSLGSSTEYPEEEDEWKKSMMEKCMKQWFDRHVSNEVMKEGTANEPYIVQRLSMQQWVCDVYEVGMLQSTRSRGWIAVSPDAILVGSISSPDGIFQEDDNQVMFAEFKTRQKPNSIQKALKASQLHGELVFCNYGDDVFTACIFTQRTGSSYFTKQRSLGSSTEFTLLQP
jgi:hypothetical protein